MRSGIITRLSVVRGPGPAEIRADFAPEPGTIGTVRTPLAVPTGATAVRPAWSDLPPGLRELIEAHLGAPVRRAVSQGSGFTPGFASRLELADGGRAFVKAASDERPWLLAAYASEVTKLALLPAEVAAPRLRASLRESVGGSQWLVLVFDEVAGRPPVRPWRRDEAAAALAATAEISRALTPSPDGFPWEDLSADLARMQPAGEDPLEATEWQPHRPELCELLVATEDLLAGDTLVHGDLRDDNLIVDADGRMWVCDWNFPILGPVWADAVCLAISMFGDGLDADALLAGTGLLTGADGAAVDCLLTHLLRYFLASAGQEPNPTSPYLRAHQRWYAEVTAGWLRSRRGW